MITPNGCHNRTGYVSSYPVLDGYRIENGKLMPQTRELVNASHGEPCQFTLSDLGRVEPGCFGCKLRAEA